MTMKNRIGIAAIAILTGGVLLIGGATGGYAIAAHNAPIVEEASTQPVPCNLRLVWDRVEQDYLAVYEDSAMVSYTGVYGRIANLSCTAERGVRSVDDRCRSSWILLEPGSPDWVFRNA